MKVLFVCKANVGRSQMASALFNKYSKNNSSQSAGTDVNEKEGQKIGNNEKAKFVWEVMDKEGIDVRNNKRRQITELMTMDFDKIVMLTPPTWPPFLTNNPKVIFWNIEDAKNADYNFHVKIREDIKKKVISLIEEVG
jgi:protein-tyrosine-phosphatase